MFATNNDKEALQWLKVKRLNLRSKGFFLFRNNFNPQICSHFRSPSPNQSLTNWMQCKFIKVPNTLPNHVDDHRTLKRRRRIRRAPRKYPPSPLVEGFPVENWSLSNPKHPRSVINPFENNQQPREMSKPESLEEEVVQFLPGRHPLTFAAAVQFSWQRPLRRRPKILSV